MDIHNWNHGYIHNQLFLTFHTLIHIFENYGYLILLLISIRVNCRHPDDNWIMDNCCEPLISNYTDIHNWMMDIHNWIIEVHTLIMDIHNIHGFPWLIAPGFPYIHICDWQLKNTDIHNSRLLTSIVLLTMWVTWHTYFDNSSPGSDLYTALSAKSLALIAEHA